MKRYVLGLFMLLCVSASVFAADSGRKHITLSQSPQRKQFPFSDAVLVGDTLYIGGAVGFDKSGKPPSDAEEEARLAMDTFKQVVESQGMTMDDLVSVRVYSTDFGLYDKFNGVYRTYFHGDFPARAFIGVASLIRGAHFEITGIAVRGGK